MHHWRIITLEGATFYVGFDSTGLVMQVDMDVFKKKTGLIRKPKWRRNGPLILSDQTARAMDVALNHEARER